MKCPECSIELEKLSPCLYKCRGDGIFGIYTEKQLQAMNSFFSNTPKGLLGDEFEILKKLDDADPK